MSPFLLQIVFCILGVLLQLLAMYYASRPLMRAMNRRKMNELPKLAPPVEVREPKPAPPWQERERPPVASKVPVSAIVPEPKESTLRAGLLTKTEKVHFIH
jgi:hypothetical protein